MNRKEAIRTAAILDCLAVEVYTCGKKIFVFRTPQQVFDMVSNGIKLHIVKEVKGKKNG